MSDDLRLMAILAHPDDESLGIGGTLAKYSREGVQTFLVTATRGERGRYGELPEHPGYEAVGRLREAELRCAAATLGVKQVDFLDYMDGDLDKADPGEVVAKIVDYIRIHRPHVVITFGPEGAYGHPDHIAISQFAAAAVTCAANPDFAAYNGNPLAAQPHQVSKFYFIAWTRAVWDAYLAAFRDLKTVVDNVERRVTPAPDWMVTTHIDTTEVWETVWQAVQCHKTQLTIYSKLADLPLEHHRTIWGTQQYYRVFSSVNGGRRLETDLFEGLREMTLHRKEQLR
jgi:LmbE family N-acetylglucosaminyl deacetylase